MSRYVIPGLLVAALSASSALVADTKVEGFKLGLGLGLNTSGYADPDQKKEGDLVASTTRLGASFVASYIHLIDAFAVGVELNATMPFGTKKSNVDPDETSNYVELKPKFGFGGHLVLGANLDGTMPAIKVGYQKAGLKTEGVGDYKDDKSKKTELSAGGLSWGFAMDKALTDNFVIGLSAMRHTGSGKIKVDGKEQTDKTNLKSWDVQVRGMYQF